MKREHSEEIAGVRLTHADRVLYPEQGATKADLARYYARVGDRILPYVRGRPLSTVRCPKGRAGPCFFQKHLGDSLSAPVKAIKVDESAGAADYIGVDSVEALVTLVQFGVLELHPWGATADNLDAPDMLTFDLDPGPGVDFPFVKEVAARVREALESVGLWPYLKTTGGKGVHVVVPILPDTEWATAKAFCETVARHLVSEDPKRLIATASKVKREGKLFIDYLRNGRGATSVAPYSTRARPGAPVAVPLRWDELGRLESSSQYDIESALRRISRLNSDPWESFETNRRSISAIAV